MKKEIILLLLLLAIGSTWLLSCTKDPPPNTNPPPIDYTVLPPITQTGANTFGCLVNGEVWVPRVELWVPWYDLAASFSEKDGSGIGSITCRLLTEDQDDFMQVVFGPTLLKTGEYFGGVNYASLRIGSMPRYKSSPLDSLLNRVSVTLIDTTQNIISGTFQFILRNSQGPPDIIMITDGRFDMRYYPD
jgi:hypothetical protein